MTISRTRAAVLAERGLAAVVGGQMVAALREDSPLAGVGLTDDDLICVSEAVADEARTEDVDCSLTDADVSGLVTVADLVGAIAQRGEDAG